MMPLTLLSILLMAMEALLSICWPQATTLLTVLTRCVQIFPGSSWMMPLTLLSILLMAMEALLSICWPHSTRSVTISAKTSPIRPGSSASTSMMAATMSGTASASSTTMTGMASIRAPRSLMPAFAIWGAAAIRAVTVALMI